MPGQRGQACGDHNNDGCLEWGADQDCGGLTCSNGFCSVSCSDECTVKGARKCESNSTGYSSCSDYNLDGCLEWGDPIPCPNAQTCSNGNCQTSCQSECTIQGARQCDGPSGYQTCGDYDANSCLEWGTPLNCQQGETCSNGYCATGCQSECYVKGARKCNGDAVQTCDDTNDDGCLSWGTPVGCDLGLTCSNGFCQETCEDECSVSGAKSCDGDGYKVCGDLDDDACLEWGTVVPCGDEATCSNGYCSAQCQDECTEAGAKKCDAEGVTTCGNVDQDPCLEWGTVAPCEDGETCTNGFCASGCENECTAVGARTCDGGGYKVCDDADEDPCLEWGSVVPCEIGDSCSNGNCSSECTDECSVVGAKQCSGDAVQSCDDTDSDPCLEWGTAVACEESDSCSNGFCVSGCSNECTVKGARTCDGAGYKDCDNHDGDACLEWGTVVACEDGETCSNGNCSTSCADECNVVGAGRCNGDAVEVCGDTDTDSCLEWGTAVPCDLGQVCSDGHCAVTCVDECTLQGGQQCTGATAFQICDDLDENGCLEWGTATPCEGGETCSGGVCVQGCQSQCSHVGARECNDTGSGYRVCADLNDDGCLEWGTASDCPADTICSDGLCGLNCTDTCSVKGARQCDSATAYQTCDDANEDGCLEWGTATPCGAPAVCSEGGCALTCTDECDAKGLRSCNTAHTGYKLCDDHDSDGCLEWGDALPCGDTMVCASGLCATQCTSECDEGQTRCNAGGTGVETCLDGNDDSCFEWGDTVPCGSGYVCNDDDCSLVSAPGAVLISELVYDGDADELYIELYGDENLDLSGFQLVGVNGSDHQEYVTIALTGSLGPDGFFVLAHPQAGGAVLTAADQIDPGVDLQDGPDSLQLRWGPSTVDAVGYGDFAGAFFAGEGTAATDVATHNALARDANNSDTDDNGVDFSEQAIPTPGTWNGPANAHPTASLVCPSGGMTDDALVFDASGSSDSDGTIADFRFDFADGTILSGTNDTVVHAWDATGAYSVTLTVTDNKGAKGSASCSVAITDANTPSVVLLSPVEDLQVTQGSVVGIQVHASPTPGRAIEKVELLVGGSVSGEADLLKPYEFTYTVPTAAVTGSTIVIQAQAVDDMDAIGVSASRNLFVRNDKPVASFTAVITAQSVIALDASACSDTETATADLEIRWDFESDGVWDTDWDTSKSLSHTYATTGEHTISMQVRDAVNQVSEDSRTVNFQDIQYLFGAINSTTWYGTIHITGDVWVPSGQTLTISEGTTVVFWEIDSDPANGVGDLDMEIQGTLKVEGTEAAPVIFTVKPESGDTKTTSSWNRITLAASATGSTIDHAIVEYADVGLEIKAPVDITNSEFRFNRVGVFAESETAGITIDDTEIHNSVEEGLKAFSAIITSDGLVSRLNGGAGVMLRTSDGHSFTNCIVTENDGFGFSIDRSNAWLTECSITYNGEAGVRYMGDAAGSLTYSQIKYNTNEGVRAEPTSNKSPTTNIEWNNIFSNGSGGSLVVESVGISITSSGSNSNDVTSSAWSTPNGEPILWLEDSYSDYEYYSGDAFGYVKKNNASGSTMISHTGSSSKKWNDVRSHNASTIVAHVQDDYSYATGSETVHRAAYVRTDRVKQISVMGHGQQLMARHNYWGIWPDVMSAVAFASSTDIDIQGYVGVPFDDSFDDGPYRGGDTISFDTTWGKSDFPEGVVYITGDINVANDATLTIEPDMDVLFVPVDQNSDNIGDYEIDRDGGTLIVGAEGGLTTTFDVFTNAGDFPAPSGGGYAYVRATGNGSTTMRNVLVRNGRFGLTCDGGTLDLSGVTVRESVLGGLNRTGSGTTTIASSTFEKNGGDGIAISGANAINLDDVTIQNNGGWGIDLISASGSSNVIQNSFVSCNGIGGVFQDRSKLHLHHSNLMSNGDATTGACTISGDANLYKGYGIYLRGSATGTIEYNNIEINRWEGIFASFYSSGAPNSVTVTNNNIDQNGLDQGGTSDSASISVSSSGSNSNDVSSSTWSAGGPVIEFLQASYSDYEYYSGDAFGFVKNGANNATIKSWTGSSSLQWYDVASSGATSIYAHVQDDYSYATGSVTISGVFYHSSTVTPPRTVEMSVVTKSGSLNVTGNYWGGTTPAPVIVETRSNSWSSSGFQVLPISGAGPQ